MHLFKQHGARDHQAAAGQIPVIDPPAVYRDLVLEFYRANYFHQKGHRSATAGGDGGAQVAA
jgi:hypothetical protein